MNRDLAFRIINNSINQIGKERFESRIKHDTFSIGGGFMWRLTPEGYDFWRTTSNFYQDRPSLCRYLRRYYFVQDKNFIDLTFII